MAKTKVRKKKYDPKLAKRKIIPYVINRHVNDKCYWVGNSLGDLINPLAGYFKAELTKDDALIASNSVLTNFKNRQYPWILFAAVFYNDDGYNMSQSILEDCNIEDVHVAINPWLDDSIKAMVEADGMQMSDVVYHGWFLSLGDEMADIDTHEEALLQTLTSVLDPTELKAEDYNPPKITSNMLVKALAEGEYIFKRDHK